jgi:hypothetical protein
MKVIGLNRNMEASWLKIEMLLKLQSILVTMRTICLNIKTCSLFTESIYEYWFHVILMANSFISFHRTDRLIFVQEMRLVLYEVVI